MTGPDKMPEENLSVEQTDGQTQPQLTQDFFLNLLQLPLCKTAGVCDDCGRCER